MSTTPGWPSLPPPKVPRRTRRGWLIVALLTVVLLGASAAWWGTRHQPVIEAASGTMAAVDDSLARAPDGSRVRVRVLNASGTRGFARRATSELRDRGFDVVEYDTERGTPRSSTRAIRIGPNGYGAPSGQAASSRVPIRYATSTSPSSWVATGSRRPRRSVRS